MCDRVQSSLIMAHGCPKSPITACNYSNPLFKTTIGAKHSSITYQNDAYVKCIAGITRPFMNHGVCATSDLFNSYGFVEENEKFEVGSQNDEGNLGYLMRDDHEDDDRVQNNLSLKKGSQSSNFDNALEGSSKGDNLNGIGNGKQKQLMKRPTMLAKQVIGIQSALSLGFVSQIWVDTKSWLVLEIEVRQNFLCSESGKFLLKDIKQVGDVVLVQDESVMLNEFRTVGLETLVGYSVVTPGQRNLGKVRSYTFNINSGVVEFLELDAFGYSLIPSSLVTTYALFTEDVLEVSSDTIMVHEAAASRIQRLTKGVLGTRNMETSSINLNYDNDVEEERVRPVKARKSRRKSSQRKFYPKRRDFNDDLELPMDYM